MNPHRARLAIALGLGLLAALATLPSRAFDIPTPQNTPQSKVGFFSAPKTFAPLVPLPAIDSAAPNSTGAGELPEGVSVETTVHLPPEGALERAPLLVTMTWLDRDKSVAHFRLHRPNGDHFGSRRIRVGQEIRVIDGKQVIAHTYQWALTPLASGTLTLDFARMTFQQIGAPDVTYEYLPVSRLIRVRAIPGYWPQTLPAGPAPRIVMEPLPTLAAGQPATWHLTITGQGLTTYTVRQLLEPQLIGSTDLGVGQPEIRLSPTAPVPADDDLAQTFDVRIPLLPDPHNQGATHGRLPTLSLPYLDRHAAQPGHTLATTVLTGRTVHWQPTASARFWQALDFWWWRGLILLVLLVGLGFALLDLSRRMASRRRHLRARQALAQAPTADTLWRQLQQHTGCQSSGELIARAPNPWFSAALHDLDRARFAANTTIAIDPIRDDLVRWLPLSLFRESQRAPR